jgi:hypothetical protein
MTCCFVGPGENDDVDEVATVGIGVSVGKGIEVVGAIVGSVISFLVGGIVVFDGTGVGTIVGIGGEVGICETVGLVDSCAEVGTNII